MTNFSYRKGILSRIYIIQEYCKIDYPFRFELIFGWKKMFSRKLEKAWNSKKHPESYSQFSRFIAILDSQMATSGKYATINIQYG